MHTRNWKGLSAEKIQWVQRKQKYKGQKRSKAATAIALIWAILIVFKHLAENVIRFDDANRAL